jgi:hypothetical protein
MMMRAGVCATAASGERCDGADEELQDGRREPHARDDPVDPNEPARVCVQQGVWHVGLSGRALHGDHAAALRPRVGGLQRVQLCLRPDGERECLCLDASGFALTFGLQGKTYTVFGSEDGGAPGLIPRTLDYLFRSLAGRRHSKETAVVVSFLEIYMGRVRDLGLPGADAGEVVSEGAAASSSPSRAPLRPHSALRSGRPDIKSDTTRWFQEAEQVRGTFGRAGEDFTQDIASQYAKQALEIREDKSGTVYVEGLTVIKVTSAEQTLEIVRRGMKLRATQETKMNSVSSRSHTVLSINVLQKDKHSGQTVSGMLNLVDLAGSERLKRSESEGMRKQEAMSINSSLTALGKVVIALQTQTLTAAGDAAMASDPTMAGMSGDGGHVPYRDSKLTRVLQNSLGGNSFTTLIATVHPRGEDVEESLSTLQFAHRCRSVINRPKVNVTLVDDEDKERRLRQLEAENAMLRRQLATARVTTKMRILRLMADIGISGQIVKDGRFVATDGRVFGITIRQALRSAWAKKAIAASLAPGGRYSAAGIAKALQAAAMFKSALGRGLEGAAADAAAAEMGVADEMEEDEGVMPLEMRHVLEVPAMTKEEADEGDQQVTTAKKVLTTQGSPAAFAGGASALAAASSASVSVRLASRGASTRMSARSSSGLPPVAVPPGGGALLGATGGGSATPVDSQLVDDLKMKIAELSKELQRAQSKSKSESETLRNLAREQRERASEARAVAEDTSRAARDEVDKTSSSYSRQVAALMAHSQSLLHEQHELVAAVPRSLRVAETALQEAAEVEDRVRKEEREKQRMALARAQETAATELAELKESSRQTVQGLHDEISKMASEFRGWSARAREKEVGLESELRTLWEYSAMLGQVLREIEAGRFAVEHTRAGKKAFRVPPELLPTDPFSAHPTGMSHLRRLLDREAGGQAEASPLPRGLRPPPSRQTSADPFAQTGTQSVAASLTRSVRGGSSTAWSSRRRGRPGTTGKHGKAAAEALSDSVGASVAHGGRAPPKREDVLNEGEVDSGMEELEGKDAGIDERLRAMEADMLARAARGDVDLESDVEAMPLDELRLQIQALRVYIESGLRKRVEEELVNDLAEQPSVDYVRTLEQQRDVARSRLEEEVARTRELQVSYNALKRQLERASRAVLGAPPADDESAAMALARSGHASRAGPTARATAASLARKLHPDALPPVGQQQRGNLGQSRVFTPQTGGAASRGLDPALARGLMHSQSAAEVASKRK